MRTPNRICQNCKLMLRQGNKHFISIWSRRNQLTSKLISKFYDPKLSIIAFQTHSLHFAYARTDPFYYSVTHSLVHFAFYFNFQAINHVRDCDHRSFIDSKIHAPKMDCDNFIRFSLFGAGKISILWLFGFHQPNQPKTEFKIYPLISIKMD